MSVQDVIGIIVVLTPLAAILFLIRWIGRRTQAQAKQAADEFEAFLEQIREGDLPKVQNALRRSTLIGPAEDRALEVALEAGQPDVVKLLLERWSIPGDVTPLLLLLNRGVLKESMRESFEGCWGPWDSDFPTRILRVFSPS